MIGLKGVSKVFRAHGREVRAVERVDLSVGEGEVVGLVGESGSGKSTVGKILAGLLEPDAGELVYDGRTYAGLDRDARKKFRRDVQMVFQNPLYSLNPRMTAGQYSGGGAAIAIFFPLPRAFGYHHRW